MNASNGNSNHTKYNYVNILDTDLQIEQIYEVTLHTVHLKKINPGWPTIFPLCSTKREYRIVVFVFEMGWAKKCLLNQIRKAEVYSCDKDPIGPIPKSIPETY